MKRIAAAAAFLLLCTAISPAEAATLRPIDRDGLNVRTGPGTDYAIVSGLGFDQTATVLGQEGDWYRIRLSSGAEGWVASWFSRILFEDEARYAVVATDILNVRREPSLDAPVVTRIFQDQYVRLLEINPEWWRIQLDDGTEGWVFAQYMQQTTTTPPEGTGTTPVPTTPEVPVVPPALQAPPAPAGTVPAVSFAPPRTAVPLPGKVAQVKAETGIYAGPNSEARRMDTVRPGEALRLLDANGGWVRVQSPGGQRGWVPGSLVQVTDGGLRIALADASWSLERGAVAPAVPSSPSAPTPAVGMARVGEQEATLYLIPAVASRVLGTLPAGEPVEVLQRDGAWLKVKQESGQVGWAQTAYFGAVETAAPESVSDSDSDSDTSAAPAAPVRGFKVTMTQTASGMNRLEVAAPGQVVGQPVLQDGALLIPFATGETAEREMPLNFLGVEAVAVTPAGLRLELVGEPEVRVESNLTGSLLLSLRPVLGPISLETVDGKDVVRFGVSGQTQPRALAQGGQIVVDFPGAVLGGLPYPAGVQVAEHATGVRVVVPSNRAFALKRADSGYYLVTYPSGLAGKVIMLDPGHGGDDGGAVSRAVGVVEKDVNLQVALRLRAVLEERGAVVYMTRATDQRPAPESFLNGGEGEPRDQLDLQYRTMMANALGVDLFVSLHHNSGETLSQGTEVYYTGTTLNGGGSRQVAGLLQQELVAALGTWNRGVRDDTFFVTRNTDAPAALVELAFINNPNEGPHTADPTFQEAAAQAMARALERFYAPR